MIKMKLPLLAVAEEGNEENLQISEISWCLACVDSRSILEPSKSKGYSLAGIRRQMIIISKYLGPPLLAFVATQHGL